MNSSTSKWGFIEALLLSADDAFPSPLKEADTVRNAGPGWDVGVPFPTAASPTNPNPPSSPRSAILDLTRSHIGVKETTQSEQRGETRENKFGRRSQLRIQQEGLLSLDRERDSPFPRVSNQSITSDTIPNCIRHHQLHQFLLQSFSLQVTPCGRKYLGSTTGAAELTLRSSLGNYTSRSSRHPHIFNMREEDREGLPISSDGGERVRTYG